MKTQKSTCTGCRVVITFDTDEPKWMGGQTWYDASVLDVDNNGQHCADTDDEHTPLLCTGCGQPIEPLTDFPGPLCLTCYAKSQEGAPMPTADDIVSMWGGRA